jgi:hypothetical protein
LNTIQPKIKVFCAVPTIGNVCDAQTYFWRATEAKYADRVEFIWPAQCVRRIFHDFARNELVGEFLSSKADIMFFLDSDVCPPNDLFDIVLEHDKWKLAGAPYPVQMVPGGHERPQILFTAYKGRSSGGLVAANIPSQGTEFIDGLATGCLFIKREILEALPKPYFAFAYEEETRKMTAGEDLSFCRRMTDLGHKFYVDYSKVCKHYKTVCLLEMNNYAIDYAKASVNAYAAMIKPEMDKLSARIRAKASEQKPSTLVAPSGKPIETIINRFRT